MGRSQSDLTFTYTCLGIRLQPKPLILGLLLSVRATRVSAFSPPQPYSKYDEKRQAIQMWASFVEVTRSTRGLLSFAFPFVKNHACLWFPRGSVLWVSGSWLNFVKKIPDWFSFLLALPMDEWTQLTIFICEGEQMQSCSFTAPPFWQDKGKLQTSS